MPAKWLLMYFFLFSASSLDSSKVIFLFSGQQQVSAFLTFSQSDAAPFLTFFHGQLPFLCFHGPLPFLCIHSPQKKKNGGDSNHQPPVPTTDALDHSTIVVPAYYYCLYFG